MRKDSGITLIEVVVSITLATALLGGFMVLLNRMVHFKGTSDTLAQIKQIETALETTYRENIRYIEQNCLGWTDASCNTLTILPQRHSTDSTILLLHTYSETATSSWSKAGCTLSGTSPSYAVTCKDGYGEYFAYSTSNEHAANSFYRNGYDRTPYTITITSAGNSDITDTWSSGYLDGEYAVYSQKKILTVAGALKSYHLSRLTHEAIVNTCDSVNGGLDSYDDVIIPWYFQATGNAPAQECTGIESGICGCSVFADSDKWPTSPEWADVNSTSEFSVLFASIGLNTAYRADGYGNPIVIWFTVDSDGALQDIPPRPQPNYNWAIKPPYRGIVGVRPDTSWVYSQSIVYAQ
ncbi:MAG: prepilin-type N-terminal cleavage/methylation domain-containing protein [Nitrospirae bacterium]|nr:prepilin-type N-terminal cleavage/methylation domain-containing protein [Nitrospirota bacterium]